MPVFTFYLTLYVRTVYGAKTLTARLSRYARRGGVIQHAPELGRKTVSP